VVLLIDIDSFKRINDPLGQDGEDTVLRQIAKRLRLSTCTADTVARLGGDEFIVLCEETNAEAARGVAERLARLPPSCTHIRRPYAANHRVDRSDAPLDPATLPPA